MPPKKKQRVSSREDDGTPPPAPLTPDRDTWPGWCEIESEPAYFNTLLQDMGVRGVKVQEIFSLDTDMLAILPRPVHAMIFLSRYKQIDTDKQESECPSTVWFANQVPEYSCATVALLNIINNIPGLELGPQLESFKNFTQPFNPLSRGDAIASFDFVRKIHNSFARKTDMLSADLQLKAKHDKAMRRKQLKAANAARAKKAAEKASKTTNGTSASTRSNPPRKTTTTKAKEGLEETESADDDDGFHFIAYMPIDNKVWKLDGMDRFPEMIAPCPTSTTPSSSTSSCDPESWLSIAQAALTARMLHFSADNIQYSLMAIVRDPALEARQALAENMRALWEAERKLTQVSGSWREFLASEDDDDGDNKGHNDTLFDSSAEYGITADAVKAAVPPFSVIRKLETECLADLLEVRQEIVSAQAGCRAAARDQSSAEREDAEKAFHRRWDYSSFVARWLQELVEVDALGELIAEVAG